MQPSGPAFQVQDSRELELDGVSYAQSDSSSAPVIRLENCPNTIVRDSRAFAGTETFLSVAPGELKNITLEGNVLGNAQKAGGGSSVGASINSRSNYGNIF